MAYLHLLVLYLALACVQSASLTPAIVPDSQLSTAPPAPAIQTLGSSDVGPEFLAIDDKQQNRNFETGSNDDKVLEDAEYWHKVALKQLKKVVSSQKRAKDNNYQKKAKNIIIFIGDGMGLTTITAGRIFKGQYLNNKSGEEEMLSFDEFPNTGLSKTYNVDKQVPDSAGTATAMFCGSKTDYGAICVDVTRSKTNASQGRLESIMDWAQAAGKRTGIVTTTRITHATPAATYARIYNRDWECDTKVPKESQGIHADIASQLVDSAPGNKFNVIMGGGLSPLGAYDAQEVNTVRFEGSTESICKRGDQRNLIEEWLENGRNNETRMFVQKREDLLNVDTKNIDSLMGIFRNNHITYAIAREKGEPSLKEMVEAAIGVLERGNESKGYVLMVEGGRIDQAHHQNYARAAMHEMLEFDKAIEAALNMTNDEETLIIVTADHSHAVTLNGYPKRGNDILGFANKATERQVYETLSYANGPGYWDHLANETRINSTHFWIPLESFTKMQRESPTYRHMATVPVKDETHGGEDVIVFANGPGSSLVRGVFEQHYLAYIMSYAGCMGPARSFDNTCPNAFMSSDATIIYSSIPTFLFLLLLSVNVF